MIGNETVFLYPKDLLVHSQSCEASSVYDSYPERPPRKIEVVHPWSLTPKQTDLQFWETGLKDFFETRLKSAIINNGTDRLIAPKVYLVSAVGELKVLTYLPNWIGRYLCGHGHLAIGEPHTKSATTYSFGADKFRGRFILDEATISKVLSGTEEVQLSEDTKVAISLFPFINNNKSKVFHTLEEFHQKYSEVKRALAGKFGFSGKVSFRTPNC